MIKLNRQQLSQFLPTHEAVKAFESLFDYVATTAPEQTDDIFTLLAAVRQPGSNFTAIEHRLVEIEQQQRRIRDTQQQIMARLKTIETLIGVQ
jgi:hypothetical protein